MATLIKRVPEYALKTPNPRFNVRKATESAARIATAFGRKVGLARLLELMFVVDRRLIVGDGRGLTDDDYASAPNEGVIPIQLGILSTAQNQLSSPWHKQLELRGDYVYLIDAVEASALSELEVETIDAVLRDYMGLEWDDLVQKVFEEAPEARSDKHKVFTLQDILVELGESEEDALASFREFDSWRTVKYGG